MLLGQNFNNAQKVQQKAFNYIMTEDNSKKTHHTGKSLSVFAEHGENMLCTEIVSDIQNTICMFSPGLSIEIVTQ